MYVSERCAAEEVEHNLFKLRAADKTLPTEPPAPLPPPGLDSSRQHYLYRHIREFVADQWKDTVCPVPGSVFPLTEADPQPSTSCEVRQEEELSSDNSEGVASPKPVRGRGRGRGRGAKKAVSSDSNLETVNGAVPSRGKASDSNLETVNGPVHGRGKARGRGSKK